MGCTLCTFKRLQRYRWNFLNDDVLLCLKVVLNPANSTDPDEMQHSMIIMVARFQCTKG